MTTPHPKWLAITLAITVLLCITGASNAGYLNSTANTSAAIKGSAGYSSFSVDGYALSGQIEYAVYDTQSAVSPFSSFDVGNGRYIYAYQIFNDSAANNVAVDYFSVGTHGITVFNIGVEATDGTDSGIRDKYFSTSDGASDGDAVNGITNSEAASFIFGGALSAGEASVFLIFSTDSTWTMTSLGGSGSGSSDPDGPYASISGGGITAGLQTGSPIPEPATLFILGLGGFFVRKARKC